MKFKLELGHVCNKGNNDMLKLNELSLEKDSDLMNVIVEKRIVHLDMNNVAFLFKEELMSFFSKIQQCYVLYLYIDHIYPEVGKDLAEAIKTLIPNQPSIHLILEEFPDYSSQALIHLAEVLSKMKETFTLEVNNLSKDSTELASSVSSLSKAIPSFMLKIPNVDAKFITGIVNKIAANVTSIDLTDCELGSTEGDFAQVLGAIHQSVEVLNLARNKLDNMETTDLVAAFKCLPRGLKKLNLSSNNLRNSNGDFAQILGAIHESVEVLNLAMNGLGDMDATDLAASFKCLPKGLKKLNVGYNDLSSMSAVDLVHSLNSISVNLMSINFYLNGFNVYSGQELNSIFKSLPKTLTRLQLKTNNLFTLAPEQLGIAFTNFHETVTFLDLGNNIDDTDDVGPPSVDMMQKLFESLPKTVVELDISNNCFGWLPEYKLTDIFSSISPNIRWLGLSSNQFEEKSGATLARVFCVLPGSLRAIDLGRNCLSQKTDAELLQALMGFNDNVISIDLKCNGLFKDKTPAQRDALLVALRQVNPYGDRLNLAHNGESVIARALAPLHSAVRQRMMNIDIIDNLILPYLTPKEDVIKNSFDYSFFRQVADSQVQENPIVEIAMEEDAVVTTPMDQDTEMEIALAPRTMKRPRDNNDSEQATKKAKF